VARTFKVTTALNMKIVALLLTISAIVSFYMGKVWRRRRVYTKHSLSRSEWKRLPREAPLESTISANKKSSLRSAMMDMVDTHTHVSISFENQGGIVDSSKRKVEH